MLHTITEMMEMLPVSVIRGNIVDVFSEVVFAGELRVENGRIQSIRRIIDEPVSGYILPGLIDAHVHIESSLLPPSQFAKLAVVHGTVGTVSDPHEIANVLGVAGVEYMLEDAARVPFHFAFGAPSCVPATGFETAGAVLGEAEVRSLLARSDIYYLTEMMNFPGVLHGDSEVLAKIEAAKAIGKPIDGHAPGLFGKDAYQYIHAGMSTDHECFTRDEAEGKLQYGMKILIREGSAARNFDTLFPLLKHHHDQMMFCSDDKHPDSLLDGHINLHLKRAVLGGIPFMKAIQVATKNPIEHYKLPCGLLREGDSADFIVVNNLQDFKVLRTIISGLEVARDGKSLISTEPASVLNNFQCTKIVPSSLEVVSQGDAFRVIDIVP
ncbi:MAG: adenine deaminase, partial [Bdellovibrionales bacterium]|nr:adenine deaminase [Bdellovibrionales bacterium]